MENIGSRLRSLREKRKLTQAELATKLGVSRTWITNIEAGRRVPTDLFIRSASVFFAVRESWLRTGDGPMRPQLTPDLSDDIVSIVEYLFQALQPSSTIPDEFIAFLQQLPFSRTVNYLCHRMKASSDHKEAQRIAALLSVAFPDFYDVTDRLYARSPSTITLSHTGVSPVRSASIKPAGKAAAGSLLYDDLSDVVSVSLPEKYLDTTRFKFIEVKGDSMEPFIHDGDYAVVAINVPPEPGEIALFYVNDHLSEEGYLVKRFHTKGTSVQLVSINTDYPPITLALGKIERMEKVVHIAHPAS